MDERTGFGYKLMLVGTIGYLCTFVFTLSYSPDVSSSSDYEDAMGIAKLFSAIAFLCFLSFMVGSLLEIKDIRLQQDQEERFSFEEIDTEPEETEDERYERIYKPETFLERHPGITFLITLLLIFFIVTMLIFGMALF